jgi:MIP family channel proteins
MSLFADFKKRFNFNVHWNESEDDSGKFARACIAEFIAMTFFVILGCGGAMTTLHSATPNMMEIASSFGFAIMVIAQFIGPLSGGHINCAVSFALFLGGRISGKRCLAYTAAQLAGSVCGALFLLAIFGTSYQGPKQNFASNQWDPTVFNDGQVWIAEMFGTAILIFNVFATIDHPVEGGGALGVFPIAMSVMVAHLFLIPIDGCSINPTRSFGPYLVASMIGHEGNFKNQQYMFWFGPLCGATVAAIVYGTYVLLVCSRIRSPSMHLSIILIRYFP